MISIKDAVDQLASRDRVAREALWAYRQAIEQSQHHLFPLFPKPARDHAPTVRRILEEVAAAPENLAGSAGRWTELVASFAAHAQEIQSRDLGILRELLGLLAQAADDSKGLSQTSQIGFEQLGKNLEQLSAAPDLETLRDGLTEHMGHLREFVAQVLADHERTTSRLATEVAQFEGRVAELETLASTDPLTGIANRRSFETLLTKAIAAGQNISLLLYDLDEFKGINDRLGHEAGDQVLMHFARHLRNEIRANDLPARIGGDEFVALLFCPLEGALRRSQQILRGLERRHEVTCNGRTLGVPIRVSVGVVEHRAGESPAALLRRADEAMYEVKRHRSAGQR
jgi:diguanylate cyclase (GGDEF)-like protein